MTTERPISRAPGDDLLLRQAAEWRAGLDLGTADPAAFTRWRDADPRHALAFLRVTAAADAAAEAGIAGPVRTERTGLSRRSALTALTLGTLVLGGGALVTSRVYARDRARTPVGRRRAVDIPGAGALMLNTDSAVSWRPGKGGVKLWLEQGEIAITLRDTAPEMRLSAGDAEVRLSPGQYNARLKGRALDLTILRGGILPPPGGAAPPAGSKSFLFTADRQIPRPASAQDLAALAAWRDGEILFIDQPLVTAVEEYNRYLVRKIVIADPALAGIRVGGRFTSNDPSAFLTALRQTLDIEAVTAGTSILLTRKII